MADDGKSPAFQFYPKDFLSSSKVLRMSPAQVGIYILLLCHCWLDNGLPANLSALAAILRMPLKTFRSLWAGALSEAFIEEDGRLYNPRLQKELRRQEAFRQRQRANGVLGGRRQKPNPETPGHTNPKKPRPFSEHEILETHSKARALQMQIADANCSGLSEGGLGETAEQPPFDRWFEQLAQAYPEQRVTRSSIAATAFCDALLRAKDGPELAFGRMQSNLENQKRGHDWRVKNMIPRMDRWLHEGLWEQRHDEAPVSQVVSEKTARTLTSASEFVKDGGRGAA